MSASRRKGTAFETDVVRYFNANGHPFAERRALYGSNDQGDITGMPGVMLECKAVKEVTLADFMDQVEIQALNANAQIGAAVIKRRMRPTADAYVVMTLHQFNEILLELEGMREGRHATQSEATG